MPVSDTFVIALARLAHLILNAYMWIIVIRSIISWVNPDPYNPIVNILYRVTEPVLRYVRSVIPPISGIDISPIIVLGAIWLFDNYFIMRLLYPVSH